MGWNNISFLHSSHVLLSENSIIIFSPMEVSLPRTEVPFVGSKVGAVAVNCLSLLISSESVCRSEKRAVALHESTAFGRSIVN